MFLDLRDSGKCLPLTAKGEISMKLVTKIILELLNANGESLKWYAEPNEIEEDLFVDVHAENGSLIFECPVSELEALCKAVRIANKAENEALTFNLSK